jgi:hypothetical protein
MEKNKKNALYQLAFSCFSRSILLDKEDYDPNVVGERAELLIKAHNEGIIFTINEIPINIHEQLEKDKNLIQKRFYNITGIKQTDLKYKLEDINKKLASLNTSQPAAENSTQKMLNELNKEPKPLNSAQNINQNINSDTIIAENELFKKLVSKNFELEEKVKKLKTLVRKLEDENDALTKKLETMISLPIF